MVATRSAAQSSPVRPGAWILAVLITGASLLLGFFVLPLDEELHPGLSVPWWLMVVAFGAVESRVVHFHFRSETGSFSLFEIPLILGLLFAAPAVVWWSAIIGTALSLRFVRRQPLVKILFNVGNLSLHTAVAAIVAHRLIAGDALAPQAWPLLFLAVAVGGGLQVLNLAAVIALAEGSVGRNQILSMWISGVVMSVVNTALALVTALIIVEEPWGLTLLSIHFVLLFGAYRSYVNERGRRRQIESLHLSTRSLRHNLQASGQISSLLAEASSVFRAERAMLYLHNAVPAGQETDGRSPGITGFKYANGAVSVEDLPDDAEAVSHIASRAGTGRLFSLPTGDGHLDELLRREAVDEAMIGALSGPSRAIGLLVLTERMGQVVGFTEEDVVLFGLLAEQAAAALENDHLEQTLDQMREIERKLAHQASHDGLTGLANRNAFIDAVGRACESGRSIGVLYIDLDDFKDVNDTLGHGVGDIVLVEVSSRLVSLVRPTDTVARLGGDEFAVLIEGGIDTPSLGAELTARRIVDALRQPVVLDGREAVVGASVGVRVSDGESIDAASVLDQADAAMYAAKRMGKGSVVVYDPQGVGNPAVDH